MIANKETPRLLPTHDFPEQGVIADCQQAVDAVAGPVTNEAEPIPPQTLITCAHCRAIKRDVNHWFILMPVHTLGEGLGGGRRTSTVVMEYGWGIFNFREFILKVHQDALPVCGQACALAKLSQFLNGK